MVGGNIHCWKTKESVSFVKILPHTRPHSQILLRFGLMALMVRCSFILFLSSNDFLYTLLHFKLFQYAAYLLG